MPLRSLVLVVVAACGATASRPATRTPSKDLTWVTPPAGPASGDPRLGTRQLAPRQPVVHDLDVIHLEVTGRDAQGEPVIDAVAPAQLLEQGNKALADGRQAEALALYRTLVADFPESRLAPIGLYNIALVQEAQGDIVAAIATYLDLAKRYPVGREAIDGSMRVAALQAERSQWRAAELTLDAVLARGDLTLADRLEAHARRGYVLLEQGEHQGAETSLNQAIAVWRRAPRIDDPYFIAMAHYYLGELAHRRFAAAPLRLPNEQLKRDIEAKQRLVIAAYDHWHDALRFSQAYWATAAGYQMSQIFYEFWQAAMKAPYPDGLDSRAYHYYEGEVAVRIRENLDKALEGHKMNVELAAVFGIENYWSQRSRERAVEILGVIAAISNQAAR